VRGGPEVVLGPDGLAAGKIDDLVDQTNASVRLSKAAVVVDPMQSLVLYLKWVYLVLFCGLSIRGIATDKMKR
jgi:hypothetical protein